MLNMLFRRGSAPLAIPLVFLGLAGCQTPPPESFVSSAVSRSGAVSRSTEAVASFRSGAEVLRARRLWLDVEEVLPYIDALESAAQGSPAQASALRAEAFAAAQVARRSETTRFLAQSSARVGASGGNEQIANTVRRRQDIHLEIRALLIERDAALANGLAAGGLDARIAERRAAREEAEGDVLAAAPEYRALRDEAIDAADASNLLGGREALVQILLGRNYGYAMMLPAWAARSAGRAGHHPAAGEPTHRGRSVFRRCGAAGQRLAPTLQHGSGRRTLRPPAAAR